MAISGRFTRSECCHGFQKSGRIGVWNKTVLVIELLHTIKANVGYVVADELQIVRDDRDATIPQREAT